MNTTRRDESKRQFYAEVKDILEKKHRESSWYMPLRYNNDKRKKPLFSRGLSVCRHLFNSFSKLKYDEKIIE